MAHHTINGVVSGSDEAPSWIEQVECLLGDEFDDATAIYSFTAAFEDMMSPEAAVADFRAWISA